MDAFVFVTENALKYGVTKSKVRGYMPTGMVIVEWPQKGYGWTRDVDPGNFAHTQEEALQQIEAQRAARVAELRKQIAQVEAQEVVIKGE